VTAWRTTFSGAVAALGTRHGKERVIAPTLDAELGIRVEVVKDLDTDRFGTFTREIPREGTALETARSKARAAIEAHGSARFGLSSEGSFGPHPSVPFVPGGVELVVLIDRETGLELTGVDVTMETNFASTCVTSVDEANAFADQVSFPSHGLIVIAAPQERPEPALGMTKGIIDRADLGKAVEEALRVHGRAWLETDMRAHLNPTRMRSVERAVQALARAAHSPCPACARPGYVRVERLGGLPCADCGAPTEKARAEVLACAGCGEREERPLPGPSHATAFDCPRCNP
jgi:hypothetical protein